MEKKFKLQVFSRGKGITKKPFNYIISGPYFKKVVVIIEYGNKYRLIEHYFNKKWEHIINTYYFDNEYVKIMNKNKKLFKKGLGKYLKEINQFLGIK